MIKYHGTPIGGTTTDAVEVLRGRHALVSHARTAQLHIVVQVCQSFVLDNGAFTQWKKTGGQIDYPKYLGWVRELHRLPNYDWCLIPDIIDGDEAENKKLVQKWRDDAPEIKSVPVWHLHESFDYLTWLIENFEIVALGSSGQWRIPGSDGWWRRMAEVMKVVCDKDGVPYRKIHGLRMLNPNIFTQMPLSSADSTNAGRRGSDIPQFGTYVPPSAGARSAIIASRIEAHNSANIWRGRQIDLF